MLNMQELILIFFFLIILTYLSMFLRTHYHTLSLLDTILIIIVLVIFVSSITVLSLDIIT